MCPVEADIILQAVPLWFHLFDWFSLAGFRRGIAAVIAQCETQKDISEAELQKYSLSSVGEAEGHHSLFKSDN